MNLKSTFLVISILFCTIHASYSQKIKIINSGMAGMDENAFVVFSISNIQKKQISDFLKSHKEIVPIKNDKNTLEFKITGAGVFKDETHFIFNRARTIAAFNSRPYVHGYNISMVWLSDSGRIFINSDISPTFNKMIKQSKIYLPRDLDDDCFYIQRITGNIVIVHYFESLGYLKYIDCDFKFKINSDGSIHLLTTSIKKDDFNI